MRFDLLGPLRIRIATGQEHTPPIVIGERELGGPRQRAVLVALALHPGTIVTTERLIDLVWGGEPPSKPPVTIRSYVSNLRRALATGRSAAGLEPGRAEPLVTRNAGYLLDVDSDAVDAHRFRRLANEARRALDEGDLSAALTRAEEALALWRVDVLSLGPPGNRYDGFASEVIQLEAVRTLTSLTRHEALLGLGRHTEAIPLLEAAAATDPLHDRTRGLLMLALHRAGRQTDALAVYRAGRRTMVEQFGLEPVAELQELERRILDDDPSLRFVPAHVYDQHAAVPGRADERAVLFTAVEQTLTASRFGPSMSNVAVSNVAVLRGEPGIGKTTLAGEAAACGQRHGAVAVWGRCHEGSAAAPLRPWAALLEDLADHPSLAGVDIISHDEAVIARFVPAMFDDSASVLEDVDRLTTFDSVTRVLRRSSRVAPLVCVFEDLHWASPITINLIAFAAAELAKERVVFICTWRDTEHLSPDHIEQLASLSRAAGPHLVDLSGIDAAAVMKLQQRLFRSPLSEEDARQLVAQTNGNPLFVTEMLRSRERTGLLQPTSTIRDMLRRRCAALPIDSAKTLIVAALSPAGFDEHLLVAATATDRTVVLEQLEHAVAARLIEDDPERPDRFRFTHALIAESLAASLSAASRADLHLKIAEALEANGAPPQQLAHHFLGGVRAGAGVRAADYARLAALEAMSLHDHDAAGQLLEAGLEALPGGSEQALRSDLLVDLAQVRKHQERALEAQSLCTEAFGLARELGDPERMAIAALVYCGWARPTNAVLREMWMGYWCPAGPSLDMLQQTVEALPTDHWLWIPVRSAIITQSFGDHEDDAYCRTLATETTAAARSGGNPRVLAGVLQNLHFKFQRDDSLDVQSQRLDELLDIASRNGFVSTEVDTRRSRYVLALDRHAPDLAEQEMSAARRAAAESADLLPQVTAEVARISLELLRGNLGQAEVNLHAAFDRYAQLGPAVLDQFGLQFVTLRREQGNLEEVEALLQWKLEGYPGPAYGAPLAAILAQLRRFEDAETLLDSFSPSEFLSYGEPVLQFITPSFFAEAVYHLDDAERAATLRPRLVPAINRTVSMFDGIAIFGSGAYYLGLLDLVIDDLDAAAEHLAAARKHHEQIGARPYLLRGLLAEVRLARRRGLDPGDLLTRAGELAESLGMAWLLPDSQGFLNTRLAH